MTEPHTTAAPGTGMSGGAQPPGDRGFVSGRGRGAWLVARFAAAALLAGVLVLAGCSSPPAPPSGSTGAATAAPAATTAPSPVAGPYKAASAEGPAENVPVPVLPEAAKEFSKEGLMAFAEYWFSTLGYVYETGDSGPMMAITEPTCEICAVVNGKLAETYAEGRWVVGGQMEVAQTISYFTPLSDGDYQAEVEVLQVRPVYYNADGTLRKAFEQYPVETNIVNAHWEEGRWIASKGELLRRNS